ncbi:tellurite resistance TerB family protein [Devosia sediminis]|uniref:TerB N-terminal domain-containing protein n=1 Tax=Devosia sediminis TaxID=2798801 RepID=A0A934MN36_9HYPH|nr:TerB N-terminal domain-containing protein [Devosia sediminis]MBJ3786361.1 TerB N-terminal domain-containing protein [Devosia sediminis]
MKVGPFHIDSGMFYLGKVLPGQREGTCGNCVVDPGATLPSSGLDTSGTSLPYWPSYQSCTPTARRTYLDWLAGGREDPGIGIGYVFLFFYGLERRLLIDGAREETATIVAEIRRLLDLHGTNASFRNHANRLLAAVGQTGGLPVVRPVPSIELRRGYELPMDVRSYLGRKVGAGKPLEAEDALMWILGLPDTNLTTPAKRCFDELVKLWGIRFAARYPAGLPITAPKTRLKMEYRSASNGFTVQIEARDESGPIPDIAAVTAPLSGLRDLLAACSDELSAYSRLLGRNPEARGTLDAEMLLPRELVGTTAMAEMRNRVELLLAGRNAARTTVGLLAEALALDISGPERIASAISNRIGAYLDRLDIGFEPDRRYGAAPLMTGGHVVLFKSSGGGPVDGEAAAFSAARAMVDVAALAASADSRIDGGEIEAITGDIRNMAGLGGVERARLIAYATTLLADTSMHKFALNKLKTLDASARLSVLNSATGAILADGHASPAELKFLERLHKAMGLPTEGVYAMLHRGAVVIDEPVPVAPERRTAGIPIPPPPSPPSEPERAQVTIDTSRLERLRSETSAVSELLAGIFVEEEERTAAPPGPPVEVADGTLFAGLDVAHSELLRTVLRGEASDRVRFDAAARHLRLLPEGAIERINDWGYDRFEEPILEGDDELSIAPHIVDQLKESESAA